MSTTPGPTIDATTIVSLLSTLAILGLAYLASLQLLPGGPSTSPKTRFLFVWHAFDALIHFILEGSYLWNCFFSYTAATNAPSNPLEPTEGGKSLAASEFLPANVFFLGHADRVYGSAYGTNPFAALWMEYAKADGRWGGTDLTVVSLELLTVFVAGPMAVWICYCLRKQRADGWFWMVVLATGEIYGGAFVT